MKKLYSLLLLGGLLFFGVQSVWGADVCKNTHIYFDNTISKWGGDGYKFFYFDINDTHGWKFAAITNTTLLHHERTDGTWGGYSYVRLVAFSGDWSEGEVMGGYDNIHDNCTNMTNTYNNFGFGSDYAYYIRPDAKGGKDSQASLSVGTIGGTTYAALNNCAQTVGIKVANHVGIYSAPATATAKLTGTGYTFSNWTTCGTAANGSVAAGSTTTTMSVGGGYRAIVTLSYTSVADDYEFVGWFDESGNLLENDDEYVFYPNASGNVFAYFRPTTYTRDVTNGNYGTICLPRAVSSISGADLFEVAGYRGTADNITSVVLKAAPATLVAGKPYIFQATADKLIATYTGDFVSDPVAGDNGLIGKFEAETITTAHGTSYILRNNEVCKVVEGGSGVICSANRAYFDFYGLVPVSAPGVREIPMAPSDATNIQNINDNENIVKFIENGKLLIRKDGVVYDVTGRIVK